MRFKSFNIGSLILKFLVLCIGIPVLVVAPGTGESGGRAEKSNIPLLVETGWLAKNRGSSKLRVIDFGRTTEDYQAGHIPSAVFVDRKTVWDVVDGIPGMLPAVETVVEALEEAGISTDSTVVIYDGAGGLWASRLFWALEYLGHRNVHVLNGGWDKWIGEGREVQMEAPVVPRGSFKAQVQPDLLATKKYVLENLGNPSVQIVDTRTPKEYIGEDVRATRGGHMPGATNINWVSHLAGGASKTFLPEEKLAQLYDSQGISKDKIAVTHCQTGVRGAHTYFVFRVLGFTRVRVYDGSWAEWGNDPETPIVTGSSAR
jgi:thiosulfate/3-mercaptopyruvate sulfurtransferase